MQAQKFMYHFWHNEDLKIHWSKVDLKDEALGMTMQSALTLVFDNDLV